MRTNLSKTLSRFIIIFFTALVTLPSLAIADDTPLSREKITSAFSAATAMEKIFDENSNWKTPEENDEDFLSDNGIQKSIEHMKANGSYTTVLSIAKKHGFKSIEGMFDIVVRTMNATMKAQASVSGMQLNDAVTAMEAQLKNMKDQGLSDQYLKQIEDNILKMQTMLASSEKSSTADTQFAKDNLEWLGQTLQSMDDGEE
ncbi:MAG: hypothetical protein ACI93R_002979 [Flavobacteriales bacterium]|jgi:hypothetical protein